MDPNLRYTITKDEYDGFEQLLLLEGLDAKCLTTTITKNVQTGEVTLEQRNGEVKQGQQHVARG